MNLLVKVCGMTRPADVEAALKLGVDLLGFIFAAKSPRRITPEAVRAMPRGEALRVGVFVEQTADEVLAIMEAAKLDLAQLHGGQDTAFCRKIGRSRVIRAFWPARHPDLASLEAEMADFAESAAFFLLDAGTCGGGHGKTQDFDRLATLSSPKPWLLAGGLKPENLALAVEKTRPFGVDLNSGVESAPGLKEIEKIRRALWAVRGKEE